MTYPHRFCYTNAFAYVLTHISLAVWGELAYLKLSNEFDEYEIEYEFDVNSAMNNHNNNTVVGLFLTTH